MTKFRSLSLSVSCVYYFHWWFRAVLKNISIYSTCFRGLSVPPRVGIELWPTAFGERLPNHCAADNPQAFGVADTPNHQGVFEFVENNQTGTLQKKFWYCPSMKDYTPTSIALCSHAFQNVNLSSCLSFKPM